MTIRVMGAAPPWGQSLLRSCLAAHSSPPPPPAYVLSALETPVDTDTTTPKRLSSARRAQPLYAGGRRHESLRNCGSPRLAKPHQAGGGGGKECVARHERSNDWPQGGTAPITRTS